MLYNKNWDAKIITSDPFTLESLIAWLEKQPAGKKYCYHNTGDCMFFKYLTAMGLDVFSVAGDYYRPSPNVCVALPEDMADVAAEEPHTFGAALARARKAAA